MKKNYKMTDLCCANCAAEIERKIGKMEGIKLCNVDFMHQKLMIEVADEEDYSVLYKKIEKTVKKVEPDCDLILI